MAEHGSLRAQLAGGVLVLAGGIDDHAGLDKLVAQLGPDVVIDLGDVRRISSLGVREWVHFMRQLAGRKVTFRRCSPPVIEQMTSVLGFRGSAKVESVLAPYACAACDATRLEVIRSASEFAADGTPPKHSCPTCGASMEFDDDPGRYRDAFS
jgi:anti-anti-sigma regulatory factor